MNQQRNMDRVIYDGFLKIGTSNYEGNDFVIVNSRDAVAILYLDESDQIYLVREFRPAQNEKIISLPAGIMDKPNENPLERVVGELKEECGIRIDKNIVDYIGPIYSSPGHDTERVHLFEAKGRNEFVGQNLDEGEEIEVLRMPFREAFEKIGTEIFDAKTCYLLTREAYKRSN